MIIKVRVHVEVELRIKAMQPLLIPGPEQIHPALGVLDVGESTYQDLGSVNRLSPGRPVNNCRRASFKSMLLAGQLSGGGFRQPLKCCDSITATRVSPPGQGKGPSCKLQASSHKLDRWQAFMV